MMLIVAAIRSCEILQDSASHQFSDWYHLDMCDIIVDDPRSDL